jgi:hypothetical protein
MSAKNTSLGTAIVYMSVGALLYWFVSKKMSGDLGMTPYDQPPQPLQTWPQYRAIQGDVPYSEYQDYVREWHTGMWGGPGTKYHCPATHNRHINTIPWQLRQDNRRGARYGEAGEG